MHDVGVPLHHHEIRHANRSEPSDPPHIISTQIHQHPMLGQLLLIGSELLGQGLVLFRGNPPGPGAGDGPDGDRPILHSHQDLRRGPDQIQAVQLQEIEVGRGVDGAQDPIEIEGAALEGHAQALAQDHLKCVPRPDVFPDPLHPLLKSISRQATGKGRVFRRLRFEIQGRKGRPCLQTPDQLPGPTPTLIVSGPKLRLGKVGIDRNG